MDKRFAEIAISELEIQTRIKELAEEISKDYKGKIPVILCVLKGGVYFLTDLTKKLKIDCEIEFMVLSSYGKQRESKGIVEIKKDLSIDMKGRDVIIVEDIFDSGLTLKYLYSYIKIRKPKSLEICTLIDRPHKRNSNVNLKAKYIGFLFSKSDFLVGFGLDDNEILRNTPYIGVLKKDYYGE